MVPAPGLLSSKAGAARILTLDRPQARNALDNNLKRALSAAIPKIARDADTYAIVLRSSRPGVFCAGGDVREIASLVATDPPAAAQALASEYALVWLLECFSKPVVALMDGLVLGGGAGITQVNTHKVAAEAYGFAMPEVHLGFFPDDGIAHALGRLPGAIGEYLAMTGRRLDRADAYCLGLITHCIDEAQFGEIERGLADAQPVDPLLDAMHRDPGPGEIVALRSTIDTCFTGATVEEITARLRAKSGAWAAATLTDIERASPLSLKVALRHVRQSRALDLRQTLCVDYRLGVRMMSAHDFREGVRANLLDKDRAPTWRPR
ncbi:MAG: enoyl-CoA hydratase/isomerase family protein, partial [Hyphomicrobiaceae bacterium]